MARLIKKADRPSENFKEIEYLIRMSLKVNNDEGNAGDDLTRFRQWIPTTFTEWDKSILEHFLYNYGLLQNDSDNKYVLDIKIENILRDDSEKMRPMVEKAVEEDFEKNDKNNKGE